MKKVKHHYLDADHRPMFGAYNVIIDTDIQKKNTRRALKQQLKEEMDYLEMEEILNEEDY